MRLLVINFSHKTFQAGICGPDEFYSGLTRFTCRDGVLVWNPVTSGLTRLAADHRDFLEGTRIYAVANIDSNLAHATAIRGDILAQETLVIPGKRVETKTIGQEDYLVELPDGFHGLTHGLHGLARAGAYDGIVEGSLWEKATNGCRILLQFLQAENKGLPSFATG